MSDIFINKYGCILDNFDSTDGDRGHLEFKNTENDDFSDHDTAQTVCNTCINTSECEFDSILREFLNPIPLRNETKSFTGYAYIRPWMIYGGLI